MSTDISIIFDAISGVLGDLMQACLVALIFFQGRDYTVLQKDPEKNDHPLIRVSRAVAICLFVAYLGASGLGEATYCSEVDPFGGNCETTIMYEATDAQRLQAGVETFVLNFAPFVLGVAIREKRKSATSR